MNDESKIIGTIEECIVLEQDFTVSVPVMAAVARFQVHHRNVAMDKRIESRKDDFDLGTRFHARLNGCFQTRHHVLDHFTGHMRSLVQDLYSLAKVTASKHGVLSVSVCSRCFSNTRTKTGTTVQRLRMFQTRGYRRSADFIVCIRCDDPRDMETEIGRLVLFSEPMREIRKNGITHYVVFERDETLLRMYLHIEPSQGHFFSADGMEVLGDDDDNKHLMSGEALLILVQALPVKQACVNGVSERAMKSAFQTLRENDHWMHKFFRIGSASKRVCSDEFESWKK